MNGSTDSTGGTGDIDAKVPSQCQTSPADLFSHLARFIRPIHVLVIYIDSRTHLTFSTEVNHTYTMLVGMFQPHQNKLVFYKAQRVVLFLETLLPTMPF